MTKPFKYPDCPSGFINCSFKLGEIDMCDMACNEVVSTEPCSICHERPAECTIYNQRVCYDCASDAYDNRNAT